MLFARAAFPMWVVILGFAAFLAPTGIATAALLVALCLICIPAMVSIGVWKRGVREPTSDVMEVWHKARHSEIIDAEFKTEDVAVIDGDQGLRP